MSEALENPPTSPSIDQRRLILEWRLPPNIGRRGDENYGPFFKIGLDMRDVPQGTILPHVRKRLEGLAADGKWHSLKLHCDSRLKVAPNCAALWALRGLAALKLEGRDGARRLLKDAAEEGVVAGAIHREVRDVAPEVANVWEQVLRECGLLAIANKWDRTRATNQRFS